MKSLLVHYRGFTLVELLIVMVIAGVMASIALPLYGDLVRSQQVKTASFELFAALNLARSEAIRRNSNVSMTPVAGKWENGWIIQTSIGAETIKSHGALKGSAVSGAPGSVVYARTGRVVAAASPSFQIDNSPVTSNVRCLRIDLSGVPRSIKGACS